MFRNRAAALADAVNRLATAQERFVAALKAARAAGIEQDELDRMVQLAAAGRPDRVAALNQLAAHLGAMAER